MNKIILALTMTILLAGCTRDAIATSPNRQAPASPQTLTIKPTGIDKLSSMNVDLTFPTTLKKPAYLPTEDVSVVLPLFPGSQKTDKAVPNLKTANPQTSYSYLGTAVELMPANIVAVENWFEQSFGTLGYQNQFKGRGNDGHNNITYYEVFFSPTDHVRVQLNLFPQGTEGTLVQYDVEYQATPKRTADSYLPSTVNKVVVTEGVSDVAEKKPRNVTVEDPHEISDLVARINSLQIDTVLRRHCPAITAPYGYRISFYEPDGTVINATIGGCTDVSLNKISLFDNKGISTWIRDKFPRAQ